MNVKRKESVLDSYGRVVDIPSAFDAARDVWRHSASAEALISTFSRYVDPHLGIMHREWLGVIYSTPDVHEVYVIGKLKSDPSIEVTLITGVVDTKETLDSIHSFTSIGLKRDGDDVSYTPKVPHNDSEEHAGIMRRLLRSIARKDSGHTVVVPKGNRFPLRNREYDVTIKLEGWRFKPSVVVEYDLFSSARDMGLMNEQHDADLSDAALALGIAAWAIRDDLAEALGAK